MYDDLSLRRDLDVDDSTFVSLGADLGAYVTGRMWVIGSEVAEYLRQEDAKALHRENGVGVTAEKGRNVIEDRTLQWSTPPTLDDPFDMQLALQFSESFDVARNMVIWEASRRQRASSAERRLHGLEKPKKSGRVKQLGGTR